MEEGHFSLCQKLAKNSVHLILDQNGGVGKYDLLEDVQLSSKGVLDIEEH